jgi:hypothetical protein
VLAAVSSSGSAAPPAFDYVAPPRFEDPNVPLYEGRSLTGLSAHERLAHSLPVAHMPSNRWEEPVVADVCERFAKSVIEGDVEVVGMMLNAELVVPDMTDPTGVSVLGLAARVGSLGMAKLLVERGAKPDGVFTVTHGRASRLPAYTRTPLLLAAEAGNLPMVRYLMSLGADDGFIASDGQMALRLAADNKHRDIVDFLPARRGGEMLRWQTHHSAAIRRIKTILSRLFMIGKFFVWYLPKALLWDLPKAVGKSVGDSAAWCYKHRKAFPGWCKRQAVRIGKGVKRAAVKVPAAIKRAAIAAPRVTKNAAVATAKGFVKAVTVTLQWLKNTAIKIGTAIANVVARILSLLHTAALAVWGVVARLKNVTFADIVGAFKAIGRAIVAIPKTLWRAFVALNKVVYTIAGSLFFGIGLAIYYLCYGTVWCVWWLVTRTLEIPVRLAGSLAKGVREIMVWFNPKL